MDKEYYREYYTIERNHWWFKARGKILSSYISKRIVDGKKISILNVGVATGSSSIMLQEFGEVTSLEYEQDCIDFIKDKVPIEIIQGSILSLPFPDHTFDLVGAFDVIEHVDDHQLAVNELKRVCKPGGSVVVTVPALMSLWGEHDVINHHYRRYSLKGLRSVFEGNGSIAFASYFNFFLFPPIFLIRNLARIFHDKNKKTLSSDFEKYKPGVISQLLFYLMKSEAVFLNKKIVLPWGVSALLHWKKGV